MKREFRSLGILFLLSNMTAATLSGTEGSLAVDVLKVGTLEFKVGERIGVSGKKEPRLFLTSINSIDSRLEEIVYGFVARMFSRAGDQKKDLDIGVLTGIVLSKYWLRRESDGSIGAWRANFHADLLTGNSDERISAMARAALYAAGGRGERVRTLGLVRGIEVALEEHFKEFSASGRVGKMSSRKRPFFLTLLFLSIVQRSRRPKWVSGGMVTPSRPTINGEEHSEKLAFFGRIEEIKWVDKKPDRIKVSVWVIPAGIDSLEYLMRMHENFDESRDGMLLGMLLYALDFFFESRGARESAKAVIAAPIGRDPLLVQFAVASSVLSAIRIFPKTVLEGISEKVEKLMTEIHGEDIEVHGRLWERTQMGEDDESERRGKFASEVVGQSQGELDGIGVVKLLEGGPFPGLFTALQEYWQTFARW